jgi:hypothetical protein
MIKVKTNRLYRLAHTVVNDGAYYSRPGEGPWPDWALWPAGTEFYVKDDPVAKRPALYLKRGSQLVSRLAGNPMYDSLVSCLVEVDPAEYTVHDIVALYNTPHALLLSALEHLGYLEPGAVAKVQGWLDDATYKAKASLLAEVSP